MENELLAEYEGQLLEKEGSGCAALLQDDKVLPEGLNVQGVFAKDAWTCCQVSQEMLLCALM